MEKIDIQDEQNSRLTSEGKLSSILQMLVVLSNRFRTKIGMLFNPGHDHVRQKTASPPITIKKTTPEIPSELRTAKTIHWRLFFKKTYAVLVNYCATMNDPDAQKLAEMLNEKSERILGHLKMLSIRTNFDAENKATLMIREIFLTFIPPHQLSPRALQLNTCIWMTMIILLKDVHETDEQPSEEVLKTTFRELLDEV